MSAAVRPELGTLPPRLAQLPVDDRGYPVPWFVSWIDGRPEFRVGDREKWRIAIQERRCWVCGDPLGAYLAFVIGPMCGVNRTTAEPPCHRDCAEWSARHCPFLSRPQMVRREDDVINNELLDEQSGGTALARNPGVTLVWMTRSYSLFSGGPGVQLIHIGPALQTRWSTRGRCATRDEVAAAVASGLPALLTLARDQDAKEGVGAVRALERMVADLERHYPALSEIHP